MKLVSVTVVKYRSITRAHRIHIDQHTVLIGPNNEGKSNLLRALVIAMSLLTKSGFYRAIGFARGAAWPTSRTDYDWVRDFPVHLQGKEPDGVSNITLEFELSSHEIQQFRESIKSNLNGTLPIRISFGRKEVAVRVAKQGRGSKVLTRKSYEITQFLSERLDFEHIPAIRTADSAREVVSAMVERELRVLEKDQCYQDALRVIGELQQPLLDRVSQSIEKTLVKFLPKVKSVKVGILPEKRSRALRGSCEIVVDDGTPTLLELKGDGVQSLAALGIMRHASESGASGRNLVVAIEEPESHLHPAAIQALKDVLDELSVAHQVVITTHNPLFVDRLCVGNNIIVHNKKAQPAKSVEELRRLLGVRAADNLRHAELVLLVEGDDDRRALTALIRCMSAKCRIALQHSTLAVEALGGGSNLAYKAGLFLDSLCVVHAFLDNDAAAKKAFEKARLEGILTDRDAHWATCLGLQESEIEDLYDPKFYATFLANTYDVNLDNKQFRSAKGKWTERVAKAFKSQGKSWDDRIKREVKSGIADLVATNPAQALLAAHAGAIEGLVSALEDRLARVVVANE